MTKVTQKTTNNRKTRSQDKVLTRTSSKVTSKVLIKKSSAASTSKSKIQSSSSDAAPVESIEHFDVRGDVTVYLVKRKGIDNAYWSTATAIEQKDVLKEFHDRIRTETGYVIQDKFADFHIEDISQRPNRASKTRATLNLIRNYQAEVEEDKMDMDTDKGNRKRKSVGEGGRVVKRSAKTKTGGVRKLKAEILKELQESERLERKETRSQLNPIDIMRKLKISDPKECCLQCATSSYRIAMEKDDYAEFSSLLKDKERVPPESEEHHRGCDLLQTAILEKKKTFVEAISEAREHPVTKPSVPQRYVDYGIKTGFHAMKGFRGSTAFRTVQESRGNRQGNAAFYKSIFTGNLMTLETTLYRTSFATNLTAYVSKPIFKDRHVIKGFLECLGKNEPLSVYFSIAAGNRELAASIVKCEDTYFGGNFNHLFGETLSFNGEKKLTSYRRNQILKRASDVQGITPFHCAAIHPTSNYLQEFAKILDAGELIETDTIGRTVAHFAAASETTACLEYLVSINFTLTQPDKFKITPIVQAARFGRSHNVEFLIKHLSKDADEIPPSLFATAVRNKRSLLHFAAFYGHVETCRLLINLGAPVDPVESLDKQTPLHFAAMNGFLDCVVVLIEEGKCNTAAVDKYQRTALHLACIHGQFEIVKYLLSVGFDSNAADSSQNLPIHYAAAFGRLEILHLLIHYGGADVNKINLWRSTACSIANMKGHLSIVKYLLELPGDRVDVNFKDQNGLSMLHHSVLENLSSSSEIAMNSRQIKLFLSMNADVNSINLDGDAVMHSLASITTYCNYFPKDWKPYYQQDIDKYKGYRATETLKNKDEDDMTGVNHHLDVANMLLEKGADINLVNNDGETCLAVAMRSNNHYLVAFLIENGASYWSDTDKDGNNFFHYFGKLAAFIDHLQPHRDVDEIQKKRFIEAADRIWKAVTKSKPDLGKLNKIINKYNNAGRTPILDSTVNAIDFQKKAMTREKQNIKKKTSQNRNSHRFGLMRFGDSNDNDNGDDSIIPVKLTFTMTHWIKYMGLLLKKFKPDMNSRIQLPKGYKKANPKVKPANYPRFTGACAIHYASSVQNAEMIKFLIQHGSDPNLHIEVEGQAYDTPLSIAYQLKKDKNQEMENDNMSTLNEIKKKFELTKPNFEKMMHDSIYTLVDNNADPFEINNIGVSALMKAATALDLKMIREMSLVRQVGKYNVNTSNETEETALMMVIDAIKKRKTLEAESDSEIILLLLNAGADVNKQFEDGDTVLMKLIRFKNADILDAVLKNTVVPVKHEIQNKLKENALILVCRLNDNKLIQIYISYLSKDKHTADRIVNDVNVKGRSALSYVSVVGNFEALRNLMTLNPDPNQHDPKSIPLIESIEGKNIEVVETLLKAGANVNSQNTDGNTALHMAIVSGRHAIVKLLLDHNADFRILNKKLQTPLHLAVDTTKKQTNRSFKIERLLLDAGADINTKDTFGRTPFHYVFADMNTIPITQGTSVLAKKVKQISKEIEAEKKREASLENYNTQFDLDPKFYANKWLMESKAVRYDATIQKLKKNKRANTQEEKEEEIEMTPEEKSVVRTYVDYNWESSTESSHHFDPVDMVKYLSSFGNIDFNAKDDFGRTPLHYAACVGAFTCTSFMIKSGVDINDVDTDGNGALQLALRNGHYDYSGMLCDAGGIVNKEVVLKTGKKATTFGYSLSLSLINIAYLIMERGVTIIQAIYDALKNGKFHMVELLLDSASDEKLKETLAEDNKNMWHIIADFEPFDSEIWNEYLQNIIPHIERLGLDLCLDSSGRSPIHYAAKHKQLNLLKYFLTNKNQRLNIFDEDGKTELDYAVESGNSDIINLLLESGSTVDTNSGPEKESVLLKAVKQSNYISAQLLLRHGAQPDADSSFGRPNAVMTACLKKDINMMRILVNASANLNTPSYIERTDKDGKHKILIHPVFIALSDYPLFELMVKSNVDLNVVGPESKPENGRTLFTYAVSLNNLEAQKLMLTKPIDLNLTDAKNGRTIFYDAYFSKLKNNQDEDTLTFNDDIYEQIFQLRGPNVNLVDTKTKMTPLEFAIRERKVSTVQRLLTRGADPNIESNGSENHFMNPEGELLPAFVHAILFNDLAIVKLLVEKSNHKINWLWHDSKKRNVLSYMLGALNDYSHQNVDMLKYILSKAPSQFKKLAVMTDDNGKNPIIYAKTTQNTNLYQVFVKSLPRDMTRDINEQNEEMENENVSDMDVDFISSLVVEEDADKERAILQEVKDRQYLAKYGYLEKNKVVKATVDPYSQLEKVGVITLDEDGSELDTMLLKAEFTYHLECTFYKLSVIYNKVLDIYILWTRWGALGAEGMHQRTPYLSKEEAVAEFKSIFKSKTGNHWDNRNTTFERVPGRYDILKTFTHPKDTIIKNFDFTRTNVPSQLSGSTLNVMKLICNFDYLSGVYNNAQIDMPFGQIPYKIIKEAQDVLMNILKMNDQINSYGNTYYYDKSKKQEVAALRNKIAQMTIDYHRLLPYKSTLDKSVLATRNVESFKQQLGRVNDLSYVGFAVNVVLAAKHHTKEIHPLDYAYRSLECSLTPISQTSSEFSMINEYMNSTSHRSHEIVDLFSVNREEERFGFRKHENDPNRMLLWHGSRIGNIMGILKQGLRAAPNTAARNGAMLGNGIYFADVFSKSVAYSTDYAKSYGSFYKVLFVCEVALGSVFTYNKSDNTGMEEKDSVKAEGTYSPYPQSAVTDKYGVTIPMGPLIERQASDFPDSYLLNNSEYCVYDKTRVKIRYMIVIKEKNQCSLCYTSNKNIKALSNQDLKDYEFSPFNKYEAEVAKSYLACQGKNIKNVYDEDLNEFMNQDLYKKDWNTPIDIDASCKVCSTCSYKVATSILINRIKSSEHNQSIPHSITNRAPCKYGKECRNQNSIGHAKKYAHWLDDQIKKKDTSASGEDMETDEDIEMSESDDANENEENEEEEQENDSEEEEDDSEDEEENDSGEDDDDDEEEEEEDDSGEDDDDEEEEEEDDD